MSKTEAAKIIAEALSPMSKTEAAKIIAEETLAPCCRCYVEHQSGLCCRCQVIHTRRES